MKYHKLWYLIQSTYITLNQYRSMDEIDYSLRGQLFSKFCGTIDKDTLLINHRDPELTHRNANEMLQILYSTKEDPAIDLFLQYLTGMTQAMHDSNNPCRSICQWFTLYPILENLRGHNLVVFRILVEYLKLILPPAYTEQNISKSQFIGHSWPINIEGYNARIEFLKKALKDLTDNLPKDES